MSPRTPYDRSRSSTSNSTDPYLRGFRPATQSGEYLSSLPATTPTSATDNLNILPQLGNSGTSRHLTRRGSIPRSIPQASGSVSRSTSGGHWANINTSAAAIVNASFPAQPMVSSGVLYSQARRSERQTPDSRSTAEPNVFDEYWANRDEQAATISSSVPTSGNIPPMSRFTSSEYRSQTGTRPNPVPEPVSRDRSTQYSPDYSTTPLSTSGIRRSNTTSSTRRGGLDPYAQSQVDRLNEAQRNGIPFEEYWKGVEGSVQRESRLSLTSRDRIIEQADRDASRGGLGFREWWTREEGNLMNLRREEDAMLTKKNARNSSQRARR